MKIEHLIPINQLCKHYKVEVSFLSNLNEIGLIEIQKVAKTAYIHQDAMSDIEKMIRMHHELKVNIEGIDVAINLLNKIERLQSELIATKNRLRLYEED